MSDSDSGSSPSSTTPAFVGPTGDLQQVSGDTQVQSSVEEHLGANTLRAELDDVERALARLDEGTYGTCEICGTEIADDLLASEPQLRSCEQYRR